MIFLRMIFKFDKRLLMFLSKTICFPLARHSHFHGVAILDFSRAEIQENFNDLISVYSGSGKHQGSSGRKVGEQTPEIQSRSPVTETRNLEIQDGKDVDVLRRPG